MQGPGFIQAALNGAARAMTPAQLAAEAAAVAALGCTSVHVHVYDAAGSRESLAPRDVAATVGAIREAVPDLQVGVSTGAWITHDVAAAVATWTDPLPDMASVNLSEAAHVATMRALVDLGVGIEAGLFLSRDADLLAASGYAPRIMRALIEPDDSPNELGTSQVEIAAGLERRLDGLGIGAPRLHHGEGPQTWDVLRAARGRGLAVRIGLEDVQALPDGTPVESNAALYEATLSL